MENESGGELLKNNDTSPRSFLDRLRRYIFGDDIFLSYARADGVTYASGLANRLAKLGYACRIDLWGTEPGEKTPKEVLRALRASSMLVVLGTSCSKNSTGMRDEISVYKSTGRQIVPIQVDGVIEETDWWPLLYGLPITAEEPSRGMTVEARKHAGEPSHRVVDRITKSFSFQTKQQRLQRTATATLGVIMVLIAAAIGLFWFAQDQINKAVAAGNRAARANHMAEAQEALNNGDPNGAVIAAQQALAVSDGTDARLFLADAYNQGVPKTIGHMDRVKGLAISPADPDTIAAIGTTTTDEGPASRLLLWRGDTAENYRAEALFFAGLEFSKGGKKIYAIALTDTDDNNQEGSDRQVYRTWSIIEYDLQLKETRRVSIPPLLAHRRSVFDENAEPTRWDIRDIVDTRLNDDGDRLLVAGYAAGAWMGNISNPYKHHLRMWIDLKSLSANYYIDVDRELSAHHSYRGDVVLLSDMQRQVVDGFNEVILVNMKTGEAIQIGEHVDGVTTLAAAPNELRIAAAGGDQRISVFTQISNDAWKQEFIELSGESGVEFLKFIDDETLAIAREDLTLTLRSLSEDHSNKDIILSGSLAWNALRMKVFFGHTAEITDMKVSADGRWVATASADRTIRLWSTKEDDRRVFLGSPNGVSHIEFDQDANYVVSADLNGSIRTHAVKLPHRYSRLVDPAAAGWEPRITNRDLDQGGGLTRAILREEWSFTRGMNWLPPNDILHIDTYSNVHSFWRGSQILASVSTDDFRQDALLANSSVGGTEAIQFTWAKVDSEGALSVQKSTYPPSEEEAATGVFSADARQFAHFNYETNSVAIYNVDVPQSPIFEIEKVYGSFLRDTYGELIAHGFAKFSKNSRYLAFPIQYDGKKAIVVVDIETQDLTTFSENFVGDAFDISTKGILAVGGRFGELFLFDLTKDRLTINHLHADRILSIAFNTNGNQLASGGEDRTFRVWSANGESSVVYSLLNPIVAVTFSPDDNEVIAASGPAIHARRTPNEAISADFLAPATVDADDRQTNVSASDVNFLVRQLQDFDRRSSIFAALGVTATPSRAQAETLISQLGSDSLKGNARFRVALELSTYKEFTQNQLYSVAAALAREPVASEISIQLQQILEKAGSGGGEAIANALGAEQDGERIIRLINFASQSFPELVELKIAIRPRLQSTNTDVRIAAALTLAGHDQSPTVLQILGDALYNGHVRRKEAADRLTANGAVSIPYLLHALDSTERVYSDRPAELGGEALHKLGNDALQALIESMRGSTGDKKVQRLEALQLFGEGASEILPDVIAILEADATADQSRQLENAAIKVVGAIGPNASEAIPHLISVMLDSDRQQLDASYAIRNIGPAAIPALAAALSDAEGYAVLVIASALGSFGPMAAPAVDELVKAINKGGTYQSDVYEALGEIGPAAAPAIPKLIDMLPIVYEFDRAYILEALGAIQSEPDIVVPAIVEILEEEAHRLPEKYLTTPETLTRMQEDGIPKDVVAKLESLHDGIDRERYIFENILYDRLEYEQFSEHGERILALSKVAGAKRGDEYGIWRKGSKALAAFGADAKSAIPTLTALKVQLSDYVDVASELEEAITEINLPTQPKSDGLRMK